MTNKKEKAIDLDVLTKEAEKEDNKLFNAVDKFFADNPYIPSLEQESAPEEETITVLNDAEGNLYTEPTESKKESSITAEAIAGTLVNLPSGPLESLFIKEILDKRLIEIDKKNKELSKTLADNFELIYGSPSLKNRHIEDIFEGEKEDIWKVLGAKEIIFDDIPEYLQDYIESSMRRTIELLF